MIENEQQEADVVSQELPGRVLLEARKAKGLESKDVASRLNLPIEVVEGLEQDDYENLPESPYVRGYLLAYIRLFELPESLLESFDIQNEINTPLLSSNHQALAGCSNDGWVKCISSGLIILLVVAVGLWLLEQSFHITDRLHPDLMGSQSELQSEQKSETMPVVAVEVTSDVAQTELEETSSQPQQITEPLDMQAGEITTAESATAEAVVDVINSQVAESIDSQEAIVPVADLVMRFSGSSWIKVDDANGDQLRSATFDDGQSLELNGDVPLKVIIGRAKNVELLFRGESVDLSPYHNRVARLTLGE